MDSKNLRGVKPEANRQRAQIQPLAKNLPQSTLIEILICHERG